MVTAAGLRVPPCSDVIQRPLDHLNGAGLLWRMAARSPPCRATGRRSRSTACSASSIGVPRCPTSCCRGGDGQLEPYCSQKKRPTASCYQSARTVRLGEGVSNPVPVGSPHLRRQDHRPAERLG